MLILWLVKAASQSLLVCIHACTRCVDEYMYVYILECMYDTQTDCKEPLLCRCANMCVYVHMCMCVYVWMYLSMRVCMYVYVYICVCKYVRIWMHVCIRMYTYVCKYVRINIYIYTYKTSTYVHAHSDIYTHESMHTCMDDLTISVSLRCSASHTYTENHACMKSCMYFIMHVDEIMHVWNHACMKSCMYEIMHVWNHAWFHHACRWNHACMKSCMYEIMHVWNNTCMALLQVAVIFTLFCVLLLLHVFNSAFKRSDTQF